MKTLIVAATMLASGSALAHPNHGAPLFHTHSWEIGLGLVALIAAVGFAYYALRSRK